MDGQIRLGQPQDMRALPPRLARTTLTLPPRLARATLTLPQQANKAGIDSLRKAILDCALQATRAEPHDSDRRLHSFIAKLSGTMECLGERELDAVLWNLMETKHVAAVSATTLLLDEIDRQPTADEQLGMAWWNGLPEERRAHWLKVAGSAAPVAAWQAFCAAESDLPIDS